MLRLDALPARSCIRVEERLAAALGSKGPVQMQLLDAQGRIQPLRITSQSNTARATDDRLINRVGALQQMGTLLQRGELDELFRQVGPLNQSDPQQVYLADSEAILQDRLKQNPSNLSDLYALALAQALQRKADLAAGTLITITKRDSTTISAQLALGIVQLYRFKPWAAEEPLNKARSLDPKNSTLKTLTIAQKLMSGQFGKAAREYQRKAEQN
jgi:predicted Zn-dependent protease